MNEVLQRMTGEELFVLTVLNGDAVYAAVEAELDRRASATGGHRTHRLTLGTHNMAARQPRARRVGALAAAA
jgi:hypothetical protein